MWIKIQSTKPDPVKYRKGAEAAAGIKPFLAGCTGLFIVPQGRSLWISIVNKFMTLLQNLVE